MMKCTVCFSLLLSALVWFSVCSKRMMSCCGKASVIYNPITPIRSKLMGFQTPGSKHTTTCQFQSAAYFTLFSWLKQQTIQTLCMRQWSSLVYICSNCVSKHLHVAVLFSSLWKNYLFSAIYESEMFWTYSIDMCKD